MFSIRVVTVDHYLSKPIEELYGHGKEDFRKEWQEPVIRIFGATVDGIKTCVHVHGVYPYMYVPYKGGDNPDRDALLLGAALDEALKTTFNSKVFRYVHKVSLTSGIPLYGYHSKQWKFFKIAFFNPYHIRRASELLLSGAILGQKFQPHEAHIPYALQFLMDHNIYGMSFVTFSKVKYRRDVEKSESMNGIREEDIFSNKVKRMTWSHFEVDALASDIVNGSGQKTTGTNPGLRAIWEDEKNLRRRQNRPSPITFPQSQSRPQNLRPTPIEVMYRNRLAQKLQSVVPQEAEAAAVGGEEPGRVFLEGESIAEASAVDEEMADVSRLIDERALSEMAGTREKFGESGSEEDDMEADSVLGRNQKAEEGAELEEEEGVDMTQPLDSDDRDTSDAEGSRHEPGRGSSGSDEEAFWRSMAEKIHQLDGAEESSSESDVEAAPSGSASEERTSDGALECSSTWSTNIMSILSEDSGCPTPSTVCQTPRTFWSNYSPNWQPHDQYDWNRNSQPFPDLPAKTAPDSFSDFPPASAEPYLDLFNPNDNQYFPSSAVTLLCGLASTASPPHTAATPATDLCASVVAPSSLCQAPGPSPSQESLSLDTRVALARKPESDRQKFLQVLKSFAGRKVPSDDQCCHLTLKQYIKDCREIVSVDFKNLCNQEMIIIEYKSRNKKSVQNKYLIKPLEKFLESWNSAERRVNEVVGGKCGESGKGGRRGGGEVEEGRNVRSVINVVESKFGEGSRVQSVRNRLTVKSMEILPEEGRRCNVNGNVISEGKIKMKLIKSRRENLEENVMEETLKKCRKLGVKSSNRGRAKEGGKETRCKAGKRKRGGSTKRTEWKSFSELDSKLISEINSSFEEYFESLVKRKKLLRKRKKNIEEGSEDEEEDEDELDDQDDYDDEDEGGEGEEEEEDLVVEEQREESSGDEKGPPSMGKIAVGKVHSRTDPIKFVTRFLSTFSRMPDVPPFSVTISLGSRETSIPVEVNFESSRKEVKNHSKKRRRKTRMENVDGPADGSSSSESGSGDSKAGKSRRQKRRKKEAYYKPLKVVVYGSPCVKEVVGKKRRLGEEEKEKAKWKNDGGESAGAEGRRQLSSGDCCGVRREQPEDRPLGGEEKAKSSSESESLVKGGYKLSDPGSSSRNVASNSPQDAPFEPNQGPDFISDSDEDRKREKSRWPRRSRKWQVFGKSPPKKIPQADTEAFTSSDDDDRKTIPQKLRSRNLLPDADGVAPVATAATQLTLEELFQNPTSSLQIGSPATNLTASPLLPTPSSPLPDLSPLTLSGNPLFASRSNSSPCAPTQPDPATSPPAEKLLLSDSPFQSSGSSTDERLWLGEEWRSLEGEPEGQTMTANCITPKRRPLTREEAIASMQYYGALEADANAAFYSDPHDVTKTVEVGPRLLTIENRSVGALKIFKSSLGVMGTEERRNMLLEGRKTERWRLVGNGDATIVPLKQPPSREAVVQWLQRENEPGEKGEEEEEERRTKVKVTEPVSSGEEANSGDEMELSLTLSGLLDEDGEEKGKATKKLTGKMEPIFEESELGPPLPQSAPKSSDPSKPSSGNSFQIRGVTLDDTFGFSHSVENLQNVRANATHQYMDMLVVELHVHTRKDFRPDPDHDPIRALFYAIAFDNPARTRQTGVIVVGDPPLSTAAVHGLCVHHVSTEKALLETLVGLVREWDPEILAGYEIEMHSWGYLVQRGFVLEMNLPLLLSRVVGDDFSGKKNSSDPVSDDVDDIPRCVRHLRISGRIILDIWRLLRHEVALTSYSFENVMYHLTHERHPLLSHETLSRCWDHPGRPSRHIVVDHYVTRVLGVIRILDQLDFIGRTSELSRLFGIQFFEVLSRGSQFRVESMMLRLAKPLSYIPASPSIAQRAAMRAPASLPLILEPESLFYTDPLIVLDFQSLYPSIIIAYNYCFSTCLGRVDSLGGREPFEFGCTQLQISPEELKSLENELNISPAGVAFVKPSVRKGVLPAMLAEILETRLMVKKSMKENKGDRLLQKVLFSRQLGLKLIANVTYGYTAANFSGRMPCIEVGDSVVSKGRETLHRAIQLVQRTRKWGARVVYGDTDSIFVLTPGRSREEAFRIGAEIAEAVTQDNPKPVKLKLEKVYQPSILQTKKRYLGYMYENPDQKKPVFEAKGIETVRRDGCPATAKVLEKAVRILFETKDVSLVRKYAVRQFAKLFEGRVNLQDLIFAKEYRGRRGYRPGACVPALHLAKQWTQYDKRAEPRVKERVPYVIVNGPPGVPLIRLVRSPRDLLSDPNLRINAVYYITKALIPAMQRCFSLLGVDVMSWYAAMPRKVHRNYKRSLPDTDSRKRATISQYFATRQCMVCCQIASGSLCPKCEQQPQVTVVCLTEKIRRWERSHDSILQICRSCCGRPSEIECASLDCPVLFRRVQATRALEQAPTLRQVITQYS